MSIHIADVPEYEANLVPMHIEYNGPANTEEFFTPSKSLLDAPVTTAYFRGLKLVGTPIPLPKDATAYVLNKEETIVAAPDTKEGFRTSFNYTPVARFSKVTGFGHDSALATNSQYLLMTEWDQISDILHA